MAKISGEENMKAIRLRNLRALGDTNEIELRPITLLLGQNSSGKSTALRALPLLKQSVRTRSNAPVLWYGDLVDFGSAKEVRSTLHPDEPIGFEFNLGLLGFPRGRYYWGAPKADEASETRFSCELDEVDGKTRLRSFTLTRDDDFLKIDVDARGAVSKCVVNGHDFSRLWNSERHRISANSIVPQLIIGGPADGPRRTFGPLDFRPLDTIDKEIRKFFADRLPKRVRDETIAALPVKIGYRSGRKFERSLEEGSVSQLSLKRLFTQLKSQNSLADFDRLRSMMMLFDLPSMLTFVSSRVERVISGVSYVGPSRATGERYYRMQELAVDQIDPQGRNLAMFLNSLTSLQQRQFSEWLLASFGYSFKLERSTGHIQLHLREANSDRFYNLADMGYGFSQVLPIMAEVWSRRNRRRAPNSAGAIIAMEQPELHLHPAYQARLADVFSSAVKSSDRAADVRFVIETHSEALINRIGSLIYERQVKPSDVAVYVFEKDLAEETIIRNVRFDEEGILQNWPVGFFNSF